MGGIGLPENLSSMLRFVRASFIKLNSLSGDGEVESIVWWAKAMSMNLRFTVHVCKYN